MPNPLTEWDITNARDLAETEPRYVKTPGYDFGDLPHVTVQPTHVVIRRELVLQLCDAAERGLKVSTP